MRKILDAIFLQSVLILFLVISYIVVANIQAASAAGTTDR